MWSITIILIIFPVLTLTETCFEENERLKKIINDATELLLKVKSDNAYGSKKEIKRDLDCSDLYNRGITDSGVYTIWPRSAASERKGLDVYCDMSEGGGWTVIMKIHLRNLDRDWKSFKEGFGEVSDTGDFYLGNDNIFMLTNQRIYNVSNSLMFSKSRRRFVQECEFRIDSELKNYTLHAPACEVAFGPNLFQNNNMQFSAKDKDNDKDPDTNCAEKLRYGWWYSVCFDGEPFKRDGELPVLVAKIRPQNFLQEKSEIEDKIITEQNI